MPAATALLATMALAQAQPVDAPTSPEIVVTAASNTKAAARRSARAITLARDGLVPRLFAPVCPRVIGVPPTEAQVVLAAIRSAAREVGAEVAASPCRTNLMVLVAKDGRAVLNAIEARRPFVHDDAMRARWQALLATPGPAWAWHATQQRQRDGGRMGGRVGNAQATRLYKNIRWDTLASVIVIDAAATRGLSAEHLGSFIAVATLAPVAIERLDRIDLPSALRLLIDNAAGQPTPGDLTSFDRAYLRAIYASQPGQNAAQVIGAMAVE